MAKQRSKSGRGSGHDGAGEGGGPGENPAGPSQLLILDRRNFLRLVGITASAAATGCQVLGSDGSSSSAFTTADFPVDFSLTAVRKEDFLVLRFDFVNFVPDPHKPTLVRKTTDPAFVVVNFQSQHLFEEAFPESAGDGSARRDPTLGEGTGKLPTTSEPPPLPPVGSRLSGPSRIAFAIPSRVVEIPRTLEGLLDLIGKLDMSVALNATPPGERQVTVTTVTPPPRLPHVPQGKRPPWRMTQLLRAQRGAFAGRFFHFPRVPPGPPIVTTQTFTPHQPQNPRQQETALEIPFRLLLSPNVHGAWAHATQPVSHNGRTELWHTRLGTRDTTTGGVDEQTPDLRKVRAIWTRDSGFPALLASTPGPAPTCGASTEPTPTRTDADRVFDVGGVVGHESLTDLDRARIVQLTSNFDRYTGADEPVPADVNLLMLTAMGGWLDVKGAWPNTRDRLEQWEHRTTFGRDHFVKKVELAVLYPFGHRAVVVTISERKFKKEHEHIAYLRKRMFIVVREPQKDYTAGRDDDSSLHAQDLRTMPFVSVKLTTLVSPNLDAANIGDNDDNKSFVPIVGGEAFRFRMEALDQEGNIIRFSAPVVVVPAQCFDVTTGVVGLDFSDVTAASALYDADPKTRPNGLTATTLDTSCPLHGQRFAYAPSIKPDDTAFETDAITFAGARYADPMTEGLPADYHHFLPVLAQATVVPEAVRHISGQNPQSQFKYHKLYHDHGFDGSANKGELILTVLPGVSLPSVSFANNSDRSGGFANPDFSLSALSRQIGPVAGPPPDVTHPDDTATPEVAAGSFEPTEFFDDFGSAMLFGVVSLRDILAHTGLDQAPKYFSRVAGAAFSVFTDLEALGNDLSDVAFTGASVLTAIQTVTGDIAAALDPSSTAADATAARDAIAGDVTAVVTALGTVQATLNGMTGLSTAVRADLAARAANLAATLSGSVTDLVNQLANLDLAAEVPKEVHTTMRWRGKVQTWDKPGSDFAGFFVPVDPTTRGPLDSADNLLLVIDVRAKTDASSAPQVNLTCTLENFKLNLFGTDHLFLTLDFDRLQFSTQLGKKPDASVVFHGISFEGPLHFIQTLQNLIPLQAFNDPPKIDVDSSGITAGISVALPAVAIGIFSLENISLAAQVKIPFIGDPLTFSFAFSTRDDPFNLTVALLGGGGYFGIEITPNGVQMLEAALEAGARLSIDLGVASGSVSAMLGIYFRVENDGGHNQLRLTGYFRVRGEVDVLGLITASITLSLSLTYEGPPVNKVSGTASLEIEIDIAFFSESVTVTCQRQFAGSNGDPGFLDVMKADGNNRPWNDYLAAFAA